MAMEPIKCKRKSDKNPIHSGKKIPVLNEWMDAQKEKKFFSPTIENMLWFSWPDKYVPYSK